MEFRVKLSGGKLFSGLDRKRKKTGKPDEQCRETDEQCREIIFRCGPETEKSPENRIFRPESLTLETTEHLSFDSNKDLLLLIPWRRCCFLQTKQAKKKTRNAKFAGGDYAVHSSTRNENICRCFLYKHFVPFK